MQNFGELPSNSSENKQSTENGPSIEERIENQKETVESFKKMADVAMSDFYLAWDYRKDAYRTLSEGESFEDDGKTIRIAVLAAKAALLNYYSSIDDLSLQMKYLSRLISPTKPEEILERKARTEAYRYIDEVKGTIDTDRKEHGLDVVTIDFIHDSPS